MNAQIYLDSIKRIDSMDEYEGLNANDTNNLLLPSGVSVLYDSKTENVKTNGLSKELDSKTKDILRIIIITDAFNVIEKYKLDACKFIFRVIRSFNNMQNSFVFFHVGSNDKIIYEPENIKEINFKIFSNWGNIWNCLVRANIYTKAILLLNNIMLNVHKNVWDDVWFNHIVRRASYSFAAYERVGYVYLQDGNGEGSPQTRNEDEKSKIVKEYVGFLYYDYNFHNKNDSIPLIVQKLKEYNETDNKLRLSNFRAHFGVLNDLLEALINDSDVSNENKTFFQQLLKESKDREKNIKNANIKE